jgi:hypothetical protein
VARSLLSAGLEMQSYRVLTALVGLLVLAVLPSPGASDPARPAIPNEVRVAPAHRAAVEEVMAVMAELGLPMPAEVDVHVYDSQMAFHRGLRQDAYVSPDRVDEIAAFAAGLARPNRVLLHSRAAKGRREWRRLIAHELTHVSQFALAGGDGRADQWLAEGVAERVAFEVLDRLKLDTLADRRARALAAARQHPAFWTGRLDLLALGSPREFTLRHQRDGSMATYQLSFLMADYLIARVSLPVVLDYFRRCRTFDRERAFAITFGQSVPAFEAEVLKHLRTLKD